jgi:hypothetical protein
MSRSSWGCEILYGDREYVQATCKYEVLAV